jgi:hypothetical protein
VALKNRPGINWYGLARLGACYARCNTFYRNLHLLCARCRHGPDAQARLPARQLLTHLRVVVATRIKWKCHSLGPQSVKNTPNRG